MKSVRVVGVGFLLAGGLMILSGQEFFGWWMHNAALNAWITAINTLSPATAHVAGLPLVSPTAFAFLCLGVGMFISATVYSFLDDLAVSILFGVPALLARVITDVAKRLAGRFGSKRRYVAYGDF
ncbi:hypothetical protein [Burkholderia ubonensis]|uniref:hypothetical protein n=1 Tax=Burkholderia ubonensis TaxID=101571 RepID=UPI000751E365|nr:hypothetical protein [Burkholderia ubonensis]KVP16938.1 hypothetical protein WJ84_01300 [Burkholderia ubonensis]